MFHTSTWNPAKIMERFTPSPDLDAFEEELIANGELKPNELSDNEKVDDFDKLKLSDDEKFLKASRPIMDLLEKLRLAKLKVYNFRKKIAVPIALVGLPLTGFIDYMLLWLQRSSDDSAAGLTFAFMGGLYWWVTQPKREYIKGYKTKMLPRIAKLFGDLTYDVDGKVPMSMLEPSKIIPNHDRYKSEDFFEGEYKGVNMQFSEIDLQVKKTSGSGKNRKTKYVTVFKGLVVLLDMKTKRFLGHTILERDKNKIVEWFKQKTSKMKRAKMVDPEFEKIFDAYTNDQVEARYLIDPLMIENLKGLYHEYEGETMASAWYDSKMLVLISSKHNHFEPPGIDIPATDPEGLLNLKNEVGKILSIVDKLDLYDPKEVERLRQQEGEAA